MWASDVNGTTSIIGKSHILSEGVDTTVNIVFSDTSITTAKIGVLFKNAVAGQRISISSITMTSANNGRKMIPRADF